MINIRRITKVKEKGVIIRYNVLVTCFVFTANIIIIYSKERHRERNGRKKEKSGREKREKRQ